MGCQRQSYSNEGTECTPRQKNTWENSPVARGRGMGVRVPEDKIYPEGLFVCFVNMTSFWNHLCHPQ